MVKRNWACVTPDRSVNTGNGSSEVKIEGLHFEFVIILADILILY